MSNELGVRVALPALHDVDCLDGDSGVAEVHDVEARTGSRGSQEEVEGCRGVTIAPAFQRLVRADREAWNLQPRW